MSRKFILSFFLILLQMLAEAAIQAKYTLSFPEPHTHYIEVTLTLSGLTTKKPLDLKMPVWTPGSYLVREFSKNVEGFSSKGKIEKVAKNTWRLIPTESTMEVTYKVYAFELSVRNAFVDTDMGLLNGSSIYYRIDSKEKVEYKVDILPPTHWKQINTALKSVNNSIWQRAAEDFDELIDAPILVGNQAVHTFDVKGVPHTVAMAGQVEYDANRLVSDMQKMCTEAANIVGEHPCSNYTFLIVNASGGSGGLEHANSCVLHTARTSYANEGQYKNFLSLVAHEYFHLWNVKRIRPIELGPFDYDNENYTRQLWISEGFTSYYDDIICQRAGVITPERLLEITSSNINTIENLPGNEVQSVGDASFDAWVKYYRPNENSGNTTTNYYTKGSILGLLLDIEILSYSKGAKSLDDLMRTLYQKYYKEKKRGFTEEEFKKECEQLAGKNLDAFFSEYVYGTSSFNYAPYFDKLGLKLLNMNADKADLGLGASFNNSGGKMTVAGILRNTPAWKYGLNVNDELIAVNGARASGDLNPFLANKTAGDTLSVLISRDGFLRELAITLEPYHTFSARIEKVSKPNESQLALLRRWWKQ
jgi:predicted metalloprotease with PDZ domain